MSEPILIRADAGGALGTGHVMRMIALAQAYQDRGGVATMACRSCPEGVAERVRREGIALEFSGDSAPDSAADLEWTINRGKSLGAKWVVLDGYHFDAEYQRALRRAGFRVLAVDDYGHCELWAADAVLNQNIFAPEFAYQSEVKGCRFLLGTRFVLLRREFRQAGLRRGDRPAKRSRVLRRILITLGGADEHNISSRILEGLGRIPEHRLEIKLVIGAGNPHSDSLCHLASRSPHNVELLRDVLDMPALYDWATGIISAGGSTCWEWLLYGLPAAIVCLADNQRPVVSALTTRHFAVDLGWHADLTPASVSESLRKWLHGDAELADESQLNGIIDGLGAERVAAVLDDTPIVLRRAAAGDARLWFEWANDPAVRANGFYPDPIPWEAHEKWFEYHRHSPDSQLWIGVDLDDRPLGYVRFHRRNREWEIGVAVARELRGRGVGRRLACLALRRFQAEHFDAALPKAPIPRERVGTNALRIRNATILARIKPVNTASIGLFRSLGFAPDTVQSTEQCCVFTCQLVNCT